MEAVEQSTPRSVTVFAWGNTILGVLGLLGALLLLVLGITFLTSKDRYAGAAGLFMSLTALGVAVAVGPQLILGIGLFKRWRWARIAAVVVSLASCLGFLFWGLVSVAGLAQEQGRVASVISLALTVVLFVYFAAQAVCLLQPAAAAAFAPTTEADASPA